ncbi:MAG: GNAT family N-acetyltransferase [Actinobacteria bacterium]|nr:GNAT family N-acetyltransferase [Actinomycetota bacterium]
MSGSGVHPLDNAAWRALQGPHAAVAERRPGAARYQPDVAPFAALPDEPDPDAWDDLRTLVGPGIGAALFRRGIEVPRGWETMFRGEGVQMVLDGALRAAGGGPADVEVERLHEGDVDAMLDLVARAQPGPFLARTIELGAYYGLRFGDRLVAMAGERMHLDGYTELSAVCTDAEFRGRGFAQALVTAVVEGVRARGAVPFLHAAATNERAIKLYDAMGFTTRATIEIIGVRAPE